MPSPLRTVIDAPYVTAATDLPGVAAGARGEVAAILGLEQAALVRFGQALVRCPVAQLRPLGAPDRRRRCGARPARA